MRIADRLDLGIFPLQDHSAAQSGVEPQLRLSLAGARISRVPRKGEDGSQLIEIAKESDLGTIGDVHPWLYWPTASRTDRGMGSWAQAFGAIVAKADGHYGTSSMLPLYDYSFSGDVRYKKREAAGPEGLPRIPEGALVIVVPGTYEGSQYELPLWADPRLVAPNVGGPGDCGTLVVDLQPDLKFCMDGSDRPGIGGRHARLQSLVRVIAVPPGQSFAGLGGEGNVLALNHGISGTDQLAGYGAVIGGVVDGPTTGGGGGPTTGQSVVGGGESGNELGKYLGSRYGDGTDDGFDPFGRGGGEVTGNADRKAPKDIGKFTPQRAEGQGVALMASLGGYGPLHCGAEHDQHQFGHDRDGNPINAGHISTSAYFFLSSQRDAPLDFEAGLYPHPPGYPLKSRVHLSYDILSFHEFGGRRVGSPPPRGKWRWWTEVPYLAPKPDGPITGQPRPPYPPPLPPPPGGPITPGPGRPTPGGGGPPTPGPGDPGGPTTGGGRRGRNPDPITGPPDGPWPRFLPPIPPWTGPWPWDEPTTGGTWPGYGGRPRGGPTTPSGGRNGGNKVVPDDGQEPGAGPGLGGNGPGFGGPGPISGGQPISGVCSNADVRDNTVNPANPGGSTMFVGLNVSRFQSMRDGRINYQQSTLGEYYRGTHAFDFRDALGRLSGRDPWTRDIELVPGLVERVGEAGPNAVGLYSIYHPLHETFAGVSFRPQLTVRTLPNFERNPQIHAGLIEADEAVRPHVLTMRPWGSQDTGSADWVYKQRPEVARPRGGTSNGGVMFCPPRFELADYFAAGEGLDVDDTTSSAATTSYVLATPGVSFALGKPSSTGGLATSAVVIGQDVAASYGALTIKQDGYELLRAYYRDASGTSETIVKVAQGGTRAALVLPASSGTTGRPSTGVAGMIRVRTGGAQDYLELYDTASSAWVAAGTTGVMPVTTVELGGTGATTLVDARANLGIGWFIDDLSPHDSSGRWGGTLAGAGARYQQDETAKSWMNDSETLGVLSVSNTTGTAGTDAGYAVTNAVASKLCEGVRYVFRVSHQQTSSFLYRFGLTRTDHGATADVVDGAYFEGSSAAGTNWYMCTAAGSARTKTATSLAVATVGYQSWREFGIELNGSGGVDFYDETTDPTTPIDTLTTHVPASGDREVRFFMQTIGAGGTYRELYLDAVIGKRSVAWTANLLG